MKRFIKKIYMLITHPILFFRFTCKNNLFVGKRSDIRKLFKMNLGKNVRFGNDIRINFYDDEKKRIKLIIGDNSYFCNRCSFLVGGLIKIGNNVLVASDVCFVSENHSIDPSNDVPYMHQDLQLEDITISDGVWIGEKVIVLGGCNVGKRSIIGAGSVVTKDIPDYCIAVGNPARVIKKYDFNSKEWKSI